MLDVLEAMDFDWVRRLDEVWGGDSADLPEINRDIRGHFAKAAAELPRRASSPLGWVVTGLGGSGKTHILGSFRRETLAGKGFFVLVDMTGVKDFWDTLLLHAVRSLSRPVENPQLPRLIAKIAAASRAGVDPEAVPTLFRDDLAGAADRTVKGLFGLYRDQAREYRDVIRALFLLASGDLDISECGRQWLQGPPLEAETASSLGFRQAGGEAKAVIAGLSWLMSLDGGFSVFALDQLDGIVKPPLLPEGGSGAGEAQTARGIVAGICAGLVSLPDLTRNCLVVLSCLFDSWGILTGHGLKTARDRFREPFKLSVLEDGTQIRSLVAARVLPAFEKTGKVPPYPTWPFPPAFLDGLGGRYPRDVLQLCDRHVKRCLAAGEAREAGLPDPGGRTGKDGARPGRPDSLSRIFLEAKAAANPEKLREKGREEVFWSRSLSCFALAFCHQRGALTEANLYVDDGDGRRGEGKSPLLHARIRFEAIGPGGRDRQLGLRAILHPHFRAFQTRLKAAMTQSGIDSRLTFRKLALIRFGAFPGGPKTRELLDQFAGSGGVWIGPSDETVRSLAALAEVERRFPRDWRQWLRQTRPLDGIDFLKDELSWLLGGNPPPAGEGDAPEVPEVAVQLIDLGAGDGPLPESPGRAERGEEPPSAIPLGRRLAGGVRGEPAALPLEALKRHVAILGGGGSGKTVLVRRLVEEAALRGVPSVVVDSANDLSRLGQPWPEPPAAWEEGDRERAERYFRRVEVKIWTPGRPGGNPLRLRPLPDLAAAAENGDELAEATTLALAALRGPLSLRDTDQARAGVVAKCLEWMARRGGGDLETLAGILADLPGDSGALEINRARAAGWGADLAGKLRGALAVNPLLRSAGGPDPVDDLFRGAGGKTRVSVVNLSALDGKEARRIFVSQLVMALFGWIRDHPARGLGSLLVIDEARDFVPSGGSTPGEEAPIRFASRARKYGMGLVLTGREPKSLDNRAINSCHSQFFGLQNSPAAIEAAEGLLQRRGVVGRLGVGEFYLKSGEFPGEPFRIQASPCLSRHSPVPPDRDEAEKLAEG
ncbi:MAG: DUF87 domain-containing protein [Planctomycetota bacterium]|jgi:hypothetical protein|nr:DUF87 domain-containing protein [Planctomycetota bacterium]